MSFSFLNKRIFRHCFTGFVAPILIFETPLIKYSIDFEITGSFYCDRREPMLVRRVSEHFCYSCVSASSSVRCLDHSSPIHNLPPGRALLTHSSPYHQTVSPNGVFTHRFTPFSNGRHEWPSLPPNS